MSTFLLILGFVLFSGLIIVHEFGHYIVARRNGIDVEEFGIGWPPRAKVLTTRKGTIYSLNWLPFGGFVKLKGEHDADSQKGSFGAASLWAKVKVMTAGVVMNLLTAFVLLTILALIGMPALLDNQFTVKSDTQVTRQDVLISYVEPNSPAAQAGLQARDQIVSLGVAGQAAVAVRSQDQLPDLTKQLAGQTVQISIKRHNQPLVKTATLRRQPAANEGYLGLSPSDYTLRRSTWSAPVVAAGLMWQLTATSLHGLASTVNSLFHGHASQATAQVTGPIGVGVLISDNSFLGIQFVLVIIAVISLSLAILNILPIPALDGGRLFVILLYRARKKVLTAGREELINGIGFVCLLTLIFVITVVDIKRNFL